MSHDIGQALCDWLGLDAHQVRSLDLHVGVGEPTIVTVTSLVSETGDPVPTQRYRLEPID